jgi:hypothetical protein
MVMIVVLLLLSKLALYIVQEHTYITLNQSDPNRQSSKFVKFCLEKCTFCHIRNKCFRRIDVIIEPIFVINLLVSFPTDLLLFFCQCSKTLPSKACMYSVQVHAEIQVLYLTIIFCICLMCLYIIIM